MASPWYWIDEEKRENSGDDEGVIVIEVNREPVEACLGSVHGLENDPVQVNRQPINYHAHENQGYNAPANEPEKTRRRRRSFHKRRPQLELAKHDYINLNALLDNQGRLELFTKITRSLEHVMHV